MASLDEDYYVLLEIPFEATLQDIRKAYRRRALKFHPDKVGPDDKKAAHMFHLLTVASDTLSDPAKRTAYDALYKARITQKRKLEAMDAGLRKARDDLEARERSAIAKRARDTDSFMEAIQRRNQIDRLREEGLRKAQAAEEQRRQMSAAKVEEAVRLAQRSKALETATVTDCTIRVKWKPETVAWTVGDLETAFARHGKVEKVMVNSKGKPSAMVIFESVLDAESAMDDHLSNHFRGLKLSWAGGTKPSCLQDLGREASSTPSSAPTSAFAAPGGFDDDYEMITLRKMAHAAAAKQAAA
ncbi:DnaJ (Hsp40), sub C, member 17 [Geranomyces michiganensis]|nr:DnaJ (Hsp40), sub C, member 17 [Geranomyces michiganensis]